MPPFVHEFPFQARRSDAFDVLARVIERLNRQGRSTRSAGVKPGMQLLTGGAFDEGALGYDSFRSFLADAERAGIVMLRPTLDSRDVEVSLAESPSRPTKEAAAPKHLIRQDLWDAFVRWDDGTHRYWDRDRGVAIIPSNREEKPPPTGVVEITPIRQETMKGWMSDFADRQGVDAQRELASVLRMEFPFRAFIESTNRLGLRGDWLTHLRDKVRKVIGAWASANGVDIDIESDVARPPRIVASTLTEGERDLRARVISYVERMTEPEMMAIPIPTRLLVS